MHQRIDGAQGCGGLCSSQAAVHVATASASHKNEWHALGSAGRGTVPTMPGALSVPLAAHVGCALLYCHTSRMITQTLTPHGFSHPFRDVM